MRREKTPPSSINCFGCRHFAITHQRNFPYACKAAGFKSKLLPSQEMFTHSGLTCQVFEKKIKR